MYIYVCMYTFICIYIQIDRPASLPPPSSPKKHRKTPPDCEWRREVAQKNATPQRKHVAVRARRMPWSSQAQGAQGSAQTKRFHPLELTPNLLSKGRFYLIGPLLRQSHIKIGFYACILVNIHLVTACFYFPRPSWRMSMTNYTIKVVVAPCVFTSPLLKRASFRRQLS
jgi:hypothetical protein